MRKIKINIEVEVPDEANFVAVENDGTVYCFGEFPHPSSHGAWFEVDDDVFCDVANVSNWRETVTEVNHYEPDGPGHWWWRVDSSQDWEPVKVTENSEGDFWCQWFGNPIKSHISSVGGEWRERIKDAN